jgi:small multidrug resistance pump
MSYLFLTIAIIAEVIATSALKASQGFSVLIPSIITILGYAVALFFLSLTLKTIPVGIAYAIWSGAGIVLISTIGWIFFKQHLDLAAIIGLGLMLAGIIVINVFSTVPIFKTLKNRSFLNGFLHFRNLLFQFIEQRRIDQTINIHFAFINTITDVKFIDMIS